MKLSCPVILDLLPLYTEGLTSPESGQLVEEHLQDCMSCKEELAALQAPKPGLPQPHGLSELPLQRVRHDLRRRKITAVVFFCSLVFLVLFTVFSHLTAPEYVSYDESGLVITPFPDGTVYASFGSQVTAYRLDTYRTEDGKQAAELTAWSTAWDAITGKAPLTVLLSSPQHPADTVYYCDNSSGGNLIPIYGTELNESGGMIALPRLVLGSYLLLAAALAVLSGVAWACLRRKHLKAAEICHWLFLLAVSYLLSHFLIKTDLATFSAQRDFLMIVIEALVISLLLRCGILLLRQYRKDQER